ncbi:MAG TPA: hypothetical protein VE569_06335, partial [Acidimicrobiia bacterium]|nr:hypothetical protein [Acidimicrobiia bacterium]
AWDATVGHAADWLSLHFATLEPWEGMTAFVEKRDPDYQGVRQRARDGGASESIWGPPVKTCEMCGAKGLPATMMFCGVCGEELAAV